MRGIFSLAIRHEIDHAFERERDEVGDVRADRRLPLESAPGETPVIDQGFPQNPLGFGRVAPQQARETAYRRARALRAPALLGHKRAQHLRLRAVANAAARRTFAPL